MSDSKSTSIKEIGKVITGTTPSSKNPEDFGDEIMFVTPTDFNNYNKFITQTARHLSSTGSNKLSNRMLPSSSVMVTCIGSDMGKVAINKEPVITNQQINSIVPNEETINSDFLYYKLIDEYETLRMLGGDGTAVPIVNKSTFESINLEIPPLHEQQVIAEVLSSLDDKIDLLHLQNQTLEQLAETLFRQWFVEEVDDESICVRLDDIAVVQNGYAFSSKEYTSEGNYTYEVFKMGHISAGGGLRQSPKTDFVTRSQHLSKWVLKKRDIVMAMTDMKDNVVILGVPALIDQSDRYVLNQRVARIYVVPNQYVTSQLFLYYYLKEPGFIAELQSKGKSGVQVNLSTEDIRSSQIIVPDIQKQQKFSDIAEEIISKQELIRTEISLLEQTRDTLLPKLMRGAVRVNN